MLKTLAELISPEIVVALISMLPLVELRGGIPYGIAALGMNHWSALIWGLAGNILVSYLLILMLPPMPKWLRKHFKFMDRFFEKLFTRTRSKHSKRMSELGHLALITFVAVPLPGSGGWTGALVAHVFGVKKRLAFPLISEGLVIAGVLITFGTEWIVNLVTG